jgi:hypothetical protein
MATRWIRFASLLFAALALIPSGAHLLELPNKIDLSGPEYLTVQQIYRGWSFAGIVVFGALISIAMLAFLVRRDRAQFVPVTIALLCVAGTQAIFWTLNYPVNQETQNWTTLPANWEALRQRWETGHAMSAALNLGALLALIAALPSHDRASSATADLRARRRIDRLELEEVES